MHELAGMPALEKLEEVVAGLDPAERALAVEGLLAGLVINENTPDYERGDFLIRSIHGGDRDDRQRWCVGERVRVGQTMRFHVRDAGSADEDLRAALRARPRRAGRHGPGRGPRVQLQRARHADVPRRPTTTPRRSPRSSIASPPRACSATARSARSGGKSFLHGFTATMVLFEASSGG